MGVLSWLNLNDMVSGIVFGLVLGVIFGDLIKAFIGWIWSKIKRVTRWLKKSANAEDSKDILEIPSSGSSTISTTGLSETELLKLVKYLRDSDSAEND